MLASQRFEKIVEMVNERGIVNTKELSQILNVTETTIRRDTEELEKQGKIIRVHGGAKSINQKSIISNRDEKDMKERTENYDKKDKVCQKAASFVKNGDCIFLDGGATIAPIVKYLKGKNVKIVTNSILVAKAFDDSESELFIIGGKYIEKYDMSVGPVALNALSNFNFDFAFLGCAGMDLERQLVYTTEMETMLIKEKAMKLAEKKYLLIDDSKLSIKAFYTFVNSSNFDAVICNDSESFKEKELPDNFILVE